MKLEDGPERVSIWGPSGSSLALIEGVDQWRKVVKDDDEEELNENKIILVRSKKDIINKKIKN